MYSTIIQIQQNEERTAKALESAERTGGTAALTDCVMLDNS